MNLRYCLMSASFDCGENRHAQTVMRELGIAYQHATPQSIGDCWWFWNCTNVPETLPPYLSELKITPSQAVGHGLTKETADRLENAGRTGAGT